MRDAHLFTVKMFLINGVGCICTFDFEYILFYFIYLFILNIMQ